MQLPKHIICYGKEGKNIYIQLKNSFTCTHIYDFDGATLLSIKLAKNGDRILLSPACSSFDQFKNFKERGNRFKKIIRDCIQE